MSEFGVSGSTRINVTVNGEDSFIDVTDDMTITQVTTKLKEAGLPAAVMENTPKYLRGAKLPIVKAKVGPKVMTLMCDEKIFPLVPIKKEVKATVSGLYITDVKGVRGPLDTPTKKKGFFARFKK